jgi:hypothetical protein
MKDIEQYKNDNLGGIVKFKFIPVDDVESIDIAIEHIITTPVVLKENKRWFDAYATLGTMQYTEVQEKTPSGDIFKCQLVAAIPKDWADISDQLNKMRNQRFIVDYTDSNGLRKLVGSIDEPLFFKSELNTKNEAAARNEHIITFFGESSHKAYIYEF